MSVHIDLLVVAAIVTALTTILVPLVIIIRAYYRMIDNLKLNTKAINSSKKERRVLLQGVLACLHGLQEHGCNGPVKDGIKAIDKFVIDELHDEGGILS